MERIGSREKVIWGERSKDRIYLGGRGIRKERVMIISWKDSRGGEG